MTRTEKKKVLALIEAANEMAERVPGATARWRDLLLKTGPGLFGYKKGTIPAWAAGPQTLGTKEGEAFRKMLEEDVPVSVKKKDAKWKETLKNRARLAIEVAELEGKRSESSIEARALDLMDHGIPTLRRMARELRAA